MRNKISLGDKLRYKLTITDRTENYYRLQYEHLVSRHLRKNEDCLKIGELRLPLLSRAEHPTREEAYYAMEIGDILYPGLFNSYKFIDEGPYEWLDVEVEAGDVVFDCGANLGIFSLYAAYRGAKVYAFEPISAAREILRKTMSLNPELEKQVEIVPYALADKEGTAEFTVLDGTLVGSSMVFSQEGRKETAKITTIDAFCRESGVVPAFIKADIEGAERLMLSGAQDTLACAAPKLSLCTYHLPDDKKVMRNLILSGNPRYKITDKWKKFYARV
ncbi:MAG TPA: FkbM family methyltransferase [Methanocorpusculum sp.]|nr:FkbM family methyltransferase [Methanocorpusculum sp.]